MFNEMPKHIMKKLEIKTTSAATYKEQKDPDNTTQQLKQLMLGFSSSDQFMIYSIGVNLEALNLKIPRAPDHQF